LLDVPAKKGLDILDVIKTALNKGKKDDPEMSGSSGLDEEEK
jgi:hypothetical protein